MIAKTLNSSSQSSLFSIIINHKIPPHVGVCLITIIMIRMMQVIKLASSTEFATKILKVSNFCTEVIHFKLEALIFTHIIIALTSKSFWGCLQIYNRMSW